MTGSPITFKGQHFLISYWDFYCYWYCIFGKGANYKLFLIVVILSLLIGFLIIIPIGGADMPVVVSMLNSYSGWAAAGIGFTLEEYCLNNHRCTSRFVRAIFLTSCARV